MHDITLEQALELFKLPRVLGQMPEGDFAGQNVEANIGGFGPYVKYGPKNFYLLREL